MNPGYVILANVSLFTPELLCENVTSHRSANFPVVTDDDRRQQLTLSLIAKEDVL